MSTPLDPEARIVALENDDTQLQATSTSLNGRVTALEAGGTGLTPEQEARLEKLETDYPDLLAKYQALNDRVTALETKANGSATPTPAAPAEPQVEGPAPIHSFQ